MLPIPFTSNAYGQSVLENQISIDILFWAHVAPAFIAIVFSFFIYRQTRKLSAFYLLLSSIAFATWSYLDLVSWSADGADLMFAWSLLDMVSALFFIFTYWFLYTFIKERDVPLWQKVASILPLAYIAYYTIIGMNLGAFYQPEVIAFENDITALGMRILESLALVIMALFTLVCYTQTKDKSRKLRIMFGGVGTTLFLAIFSFVFLVTHLLIYYNIGSASEAYNISVYSLFGMPFLISFLGYLIAKYQAFDLKLTKTIGLIVLMMLLLLVNIFI